MSWSEYKRVRIIGRGSYGRAELVVQRASGQECVIKCIQLLGMTDAEKQDVMKEAEILNSLDHPNIIRLVGHSFIEDGVLHIVTDYCERGDLFRVITDKTKKPGARFSEDVVMNWFIQIVMAIKHIHDRNILHRDIKSQNIFLTKQGIVKLGDFGIAKVLSTTNDFAKTTIGTPYNMSPELCEDRPYDQKSDIWALGCLLYELLTLNHAFDGKTLPAVILRIIRGRYKPISDEYSKPLRALVKQMLSPQPEARPSVSEILSKPFIRKYIKKIIAAKPSQGTGGPDTKGDGDVFEEDQAGRGDAATPPPPGLGSGPGSAPTKPVTAARPGRQPRKKWSVSGGKESSGRQSPLGVASGNRSPGRTSKSPRPSSAASPKPTPTSPARARPRSSRSSNSRSSSTSSSSSSGRRTWDKPSPKTTATDSASRRSLEGGRRPSEAKRKPRPKVASVGSLEATFVVSKPSTPQLSGRRSVSSSGTPSPRLSHPRFITSSASYMLEKKTTPSSIKQAANQRVLERRKEEKEARADAERQKQQHRRNIESERAQQQAELKKHAAQLRALKSNVKSKFDRSKLRKQFSTDQDPETEASADAPKPEPAPASKPRAAGPRGKKKATPPTASSSPSTSSAGPRSNKGAAAGAGDKQGASSPADKAEAAEARRAQREQHQRDLKAKMRAGRRQQKAKKEIEVEILLSDKMKEVFQRRRSPDTAPPVDLEVAAASQGHSGARHRRSYSEVEVERELNQMCSSLEHVLQDLTEEPSTEAEASVRPMSAAHAEQLKTRIQALREACVDMIGPDRFALVYSAFRNCEDEEAEEHSEEAVRSILGPAFPFQEVLRKFGNLIYCEDCLAPAR